MARLFDPLTLRGLTVESRAWVSPMCQYQAVDGMPNVWHLVHYGSLALGVPGLIVCESTGVTPIGRISAHCTGLWSEAHASAWAAIVSFVHEQGVPIGIQLGHAGRKGSTTPPWAGEGDLQISLGGWATVGPSPVAAKGLRPPVEMNSTALAETVEAFRSATLLAVTAGFDVVEVHAAHGYLLHQYLSPLSNFRTDEFGGSLENRIRFPLAVVRAVRDAWPDDRALFVRISATDWVAGGWDLDSSVAFARRLRELGVDLVDTSSGGLVADAAIPTDEGYQVGFAKEIRSRAAIATAAAGRVTDPDTADRIITDGQADAVFLARAILRDPHWPLHAAEHLGFAARWPHSYERAARRADV